MSRPRHLLLQTSFAPWAMVCFLFIATGCSKKEPPPDTTSVVEEETTASTDRNPNFTQRVKAIGHISAICINVRSSAGASANVTGHLFKGDRIDLFEDQKIGGNTWYRMNDAAGYVDGWVSGRFVSGTPVKSDFIIPADYKEQRTPSVITQVSAKYVGVEACQMCHSKPHGPFQLGEYGVWRDHYHADAYKTLTRAYSRAHAKKRGINDPLTDWRCIKCHVTAYGVPQERLGADYRDDEGVGCEACHGPGGDYLYEHWEGKPGYASREKMGFRIFKNLAARDNLCRSCHNVLSPTYKPFNVEAFSAAIRHWQNEYDFNKIAEELNKRAPAAEQEAKVPPKVVEPPPSNSEASSPPVAEKTPAPSESKREAKPAAPDATVEKPPVAEASQEKFESKPPAPAAPTETPPAKSVAAPSGGAVPARLAGVPRSFTLNKNGEQRGEVFFPHLAHNKYVKAEKEAENCIVCHHTTKPGATPVACGNCHKVQPTAEAPNREKAFHGACRDCHRELEKGPRSCSECHSA